MKRIKVNLKERSYDIIAGPGAAAALGKFIKKLKLGSDAYVITNSPVKNKYGSNLAKILKRSGFSVRFKIIPNTEKSKSQSTLGSVIKDLAGYDKRRNIFIVAFGGGVVGDLAGFVASIYKRGIPYIQVPTTLLAQVDSAIGGKTAVDLSEGKNLLGAFYQPRLVVSDTKFLKSLNLRQLRSGLAEVIKYAIIKDRQLFWFLEKRYGDILKHNPPALEYIVKRSSRIKAAIVGLDEREERGLRTILNFGHTIGHAIEQAGNFKLYNHGEAIALGMIIASYISARLKLIGNKTLLRIQNLIKNAGLPVNLKGLRLAGIINAHYRDKKFIGKTNKFVLITGIGRAKVLKNIPLGIIKEAIKKVHKE